MPSKVINSGFTSFIEQLKEIETDRKYDIYFRGHSTVVKEILPRIYRKLPYKIKSSTLNGTKTTIKNEHHIFREIILRSPQEFIGEATAIEKLVKMQHYLLPTRLLDITSNPLVALYFACSETKRTGEVVIFKIPKNKVKFYDSDTVSILANISKMDSDFELPKSDDLISFNKEWPITRLLHEIRNEKVQFEPLMKRADFNSVLPVKVKLNNHRIVRQSGAFFLFGIDESKNLPAKVNPNWIYKKIQIKASDKTAIKKDLLSLGISESTLFPEIENQAKRITEMYEIKSVNMRKKS